MKIPTKTISKVVISPCCSATGLLITSWPSSLPSITTSFDLRKFENQVLLVQQKREILLSLLWCRYTHYISKLPESRLAFDEQLAQFYSQHGATLSPPSILQTPLDCYTIFNAVAQRGGFEGVSGTR